MDTLEITSSDGHLVVRSTDGSIVGKIKSDLTITASTNTDEVIYETDELIPGVISRIDHDRDTVLVTVYYEAEE